MKRLWKKLLIKYKWVVGRYKIMPGVDKKVSNVYIWCCGATDITATNLAKELGCKVGKKKPVAKDTAMVIGWGAKTKDKVALGTIPVLNHPDYIRVNRNKFEALKLMQAGNVPVAPFVDANGINAALQNGTLTLPVIGRRRYHQGGKGFWMCPTQSHVTAAINDESGAQYFQNMIEIADEYRLHVFDGTVLHAVKKVARTRKEMEEAYIRQECDRLKSLAEKNNETFDEEATKKMLGRQAKRHAEAGPDMIIRSNRKGWKFSSVKKYSKPMADAAVKAVEALGLTFGAVDCCVDAAGNPFIIEVNTGPGLEETPFKAYVTAFKTAIEDILSPKKAPVKAPAAAKTAKKTAAGKAVAATMSGSAKERLRQRLALAADMVDAAETDEEAAVLEKVINRVLTQGGAV
jgi:glutathione synthase/RimK-type ligase-like ATP-grasp enzyme